MEDYGSSAIRHFEDAELLKASGKLDNAGHLIGFSAECAIKYKITTHRSSSGSPHGHFPDFLVTARKHLSQRTTQSSMFDLLKTDIFQGWLVSRRYHRTGITTPQELDAWFTAAKRLLATAQLKVRR